MASIYEDFTGALLECPSDLKISPEFQNTSSFSIRRGIYLSWE